MNDTTWDSAFCELFERCAKLHRAGDSRGEKWFTDADKAFLASIGYTTQEFFDFVDDHCRYGDEGPTPETALLVAAVRRDYFNVILKRLWSGKTVPPFRAAAKTRRCGRHPVAAAPDRQSTCQTGRRNGPGHDVWLRRRPRLLPRAPHPPRRLPPRDLGRRWR